MRMYIMIAMAIIIAAIAFEARSSLSWPGQYCCIRDLKYAVATRNSSQLQKHERTTGSRDQGTVLELRASISSSG
jgi:hypothetical protein